MLRSRKEITWLTLEQWQDYVDDHSHSSVFHHRRWLELISNHYGFPIKIPAVVVEKKIRCATPFLQTRSLRGRKKLISLPFTDYLPVLAQDSQSIDEITELIQNEFSAQISEAVIRGDNQIPGIPNESPSVRHEILTDRPFGEIEDETQAGRENHRASAPAGSTEPNLSCRVASPIRRTR